MFIRPSLSRVPRAPISRNTRNGVGVKCEIEETTDGGNSRRLPVYACRSSESVRSLLLSDR